MNQKQLNDCVKEAYELSVQHGFHDSDYSDQHWLMLIISEVAEAVEADRNSYLPNGNPEGFDALIKVGHTFDCVYREYIKGSVGEELADICIRIFDFAGLRDIELPEVTNDDIVCWNKHFDETNSFTDLAYYLCEVLTRFGIKTDRRLQAALIYVYSWAARLKIDLDWNIKMKMRYNKLRSIRHGKKY